MRVKLFAAALALAGITAYGQTFTEWQNPEVNAVNRAPMRAENFAFAKGE